MKLTGPARTFVIILVWLSVVFAILLLLNYFVKNSTLNYYIILLVAAMASAAVVFLIMKGTTAKFTSDSKYGKLELSGPVVVFFLVLIGGYYLPGKFSEEFDLSVFVSEKGGGSIKNAAIAFTIDNRKETRQTDANGQFVIAKIPSKYRGMPIRFEPEIKGFDKTQFTDTIPQSGNALHIDLTKKAETILITGTVLTENNQPVKNVLINFNNGLATATTDQFGNFKVSLSISEAAEISVMIYRNDSVVYNDKVLATSATPLNFYIK